MYNYNDINTCIDNDNFRELDIIFSAQPELLKEAYEGDQDTPLHYSAMYGSKEMCEYLLRKGLNVNVALRKMLTPLTYAARKNRIDLACLFLQEGAFVDGLPVSPITPLINAITYGHYEMMKLLVENGANINRLHLNNGLLPLDIAISRNQDKIIQYLRERDAKSMYTLPDWVSNECQGNGILSFVTLTTGKIFPIDINKDKSNEPVVMKMAISDDGKNKIVFTFGLFRVHECPIELFISLPYSWNFYISTPCNNFPILFLSQLILLIKNGLTIKEGDVFCKDDPHFSVLEWPKGIVSFLVCNSNWATKNKEIDRGEEVILYTLIPVNKNNSKIKIDKYRNTTWKKVTVNL